MKLDRNIFLALAGVLALGSAAALAQQVNPGSAAGAGNVTLNSGTNTVGSIANTAFGITGPVPAGTNNIGAVNPAAIGVTTTNGSGSITAGGSFQSALAASATRKGCTIQNPPTATEPLYVYFGSGTASTANSIGLNPGGTSSCAISGSYVANDAVQVSAATTGHTFVLNSQ